jgi:hypothetical protein
MGGAPAGPLGAPGVLETTGSGESAGVGLAPAPSARGPALADGGPTDVTLPRTSAGAPSAGWTLALSSADAPDEAARAAGPATATAGLDGRTLGELARLMASGAGQPLAADRQPVALALDGHAGASGPDRQPAPWTPDPDRQPALTTLDRQRVAPTPSRQPTATAPDRQPTLGGPPDWAAPGRLPGWPARAGQTGSWLGLAGCGLGAEFDACAARSALGTDAPARSGLSDGGSSTGGGPGRDRAWPGSDAAAPGGSAPTSPPVGGGGSAGSGGAGFGGAVLAATAVLLLAAWWALDERSLLIPSGITHRTRIPPR